MYNAEHFGKTDFSLNLFKNTILATTTKGKFNKGG